MSLRVLVTLIALVSLGASATSEAQQLALGGQRPHFIRAGAPAKGREVVEVRNAAVLRRSIGIQLAEATIEEALAELGRHAGVRVAYNADKLPKRKRVSLSADQIEVAAVLTQILFDSGLDVAVARNGQLAVVECTHLVTTRSEPQDSGSIMGRVTDRATGAAIAGAMVIVEGTKLSATTGIDGAYAIEGVPAGAHKVRGRYIGYAPLTASVSLSGAEEVRADLALEKSVQRLDEVVTTGTLVPTEVKALPTPVSVISGAAIDERHPRTVQDVFRQAVPTGVSADEASSPGLNPVTVRGATSLSGAGQMKILVDGVEAASFGANPVDPNSIDRIEIVRGPQAATIYGSDAAGGVVQIFTKRGQLGLTRPEVMVKAEAGVLETPYAGHKGVMRQEYSGSLRGGTSDVTYNIGAGYTRLGDWVPDGEMSAQSIPRVHGGFRFANELLTVDIGARYHVEKVPSVFNPLLLQAGLVPFSKPQYTQRNFTNQTVGLQVALTPNGWWRHQLTMGLDRASLEEIQQRPRLTDPSDTLLAFGLASSQKTSVGYNTSVQGRLTSSLWASLIVGGDHYDFPATNSNTTQALNTEGTIRTSPSGAFTTSRTVIKNTGIFAQAQLALAEALFITAGLRADDNTTFGDDLGMPVAPRVGASYLRPLGKATVKLRGSYGRAIRAPRPGQTFGSVTASQITLANPLLAPERQRGWDAGVDLVVADRISISVTGFDQTAEDLIAFVPVATDPVPTSQFQNVGRVRNRGVEVEGEYQIGSFRLRAQYGYVESQIRELGPNVEGDLQVGDAPLGVPSHTAGASVGWQPWSGTTITSGLTYVGSYTQIDAVALFRCFGGTGPCADTFRGFNATFPGFTKFNLAVTQRLTPVLSGYVSLDNATNSAAYEFGSSAPVMGRLTSVGMQVRY